MNPAVRLLNRKIHIYVGQALLLFVILFSATGLLLNHHFAFAEFWPHRQVTTVERPIRAPVQAGDLATARDLMGQLGLRGEINQTELTPAGQFSLQIARPGENVKVTADLLHGRATVERTGVNGWGVARTLHTFVGVAQGQPSRVRDWRLTQIWSLAIDATAMGLILLVFGDCTKPGRPIHAGRPDCLYSAQP